MNVALENKTSQFANLEDDSKNYCCFATCKILPEILAPSFCQAHKNNIYIKDAY